MTGLAIRPRMFARLFKSRNLMPFVMVCITAILVIFPLLRIMQISLTPEGLEAWKAVTASPLSTNLLWRPIANTMLLGAGVATGCLLLGGFLAWLVVLTDVPGRRFLGVLSTLPFMIPSFAAALAWGTLFRNDRLGGQPGYFVANGMTIPDWLAWGLLPTLIVLVAHYYSLAYTMIAAALSSVSADLVESAEWQGPSGRASCLALFYPWSRPPLYRGEC